MEDNDKGTFGSGRYENCHRDSTLWIYTTYNSSILIRMFVQHSVPGLGKGASVYACSRRSWYKGALEVMKNKKRHEHNPYFRLRKDTAFF